MNDDWRITRLTTDHFDVRVGRQCKHIEEVAPGVFHVHGWRDDAVVQVYGGPGVIVEFEERERDEL